MDVQRKRQIRLFVALGLAVALAAGLLYIGVVSTVGSSFASETSQPTELTAAVPGKSYEMTGRVIPGSIKKRGSGIAFRVSDRDGAGSLPVTYNGTVPDPFRDGREIVLKGKVENGVFVGERDTLVTKCPSKFSEKKN